MSSQTSPPQKIIAACLALLALPALAQVSRNNDRPDTFFTGIGQSFLDQRSQSTNFDLLGRADQMLTNALDSHFGGLGRLYSAVSSGDKTFFQKEAIDLLNDKSRTELRNIFPSAEVSFGVNLDRKLEASIIGLKPLKQFTEESFTLYGWQSSFVITDNRYTLNNGYVYRKLSNDQSAITGVNAFIDLEFPYQHRRASFGGEFKSAALDLNLNRYIPLTSWIEGRFGLQETALAGTTIDVTTPIPYLPRIKVNLKYSHWEGKGEGSNLDGMTYSLLGEVTPHMTISIQNRQISGLEKRTALMLNYNLTPHNEKKRGLPFVSATPYAMKDMRDRMLETVKRENTIRKQFSGFRVVTR